jgi:class 3 adenylate cyclase
MERRPATVLFCDIVDSVGLTTRLGAEEMMPLYDDYLAACDEAIERHGRNVMQYMGDGVLAYFGFPTANEDDPINAVIAGLAIREAVAALETPPDVQLRVRVGVATGLVMVSDMVGRRGDRGAGIVGETPNLAARLQSVAQPNGVVVCETTRRIAGGYAQFNDLGSVTLKGFPAPVGAFEAVAAARTPSRFRARMHGELTSLVGRDAELGLLRGAWDRAAAGQGSAVLLSGEPGIGKSRLVEEISRIAAAAGGTRLTWYCAPNRGDSAFYPILSSIAQRAGFESASGLDDRRQRLEAFLARSGDVDDRALAIVGDLVGVPMDGSAALAGLTPDRRRAETMDVLLRLTEQAFGAGPGLLVLEDLHWCDSVTLSLLDRLIARAHERKLLVLLTARPEFEPPWADGTVPQAVVQRLGRAHSEQLCIALGAGAVLPDEAIRQVVERCDGTPLFLEEMTRAVIESVAAGEGEGNVVPPIPVSVRASLAARIDHLGAARRTAALGAAIGRRFGYRLLAAVANRPETDLRADLRAMALAGIVERHGTPPDSSYVFRHALVRDAAYDSLPRREQLALHGQIAQTLRDQFPEIRDREPELLAYHFTESGAAEDAIPLWAEAGQRAGARAAHVEAIGHLRTALDLVRRGPEGPGRAVAELPLLLGLGVSLSATRSYSAPEVGQVLTDAQAICESLGNPAALYPVLVAICDFRYVAGEIGIALNAARQCLAIAGQTGLPEHRVVAESRYGYIVGMAGDIAEGRRVLENALAVYRASDGARLTFASTTDPFVHAGISLMYLLNVLGEDAERNRVRNEVIAHARALGRPYDLLFALGHSVASSMFPGLAAEAHRDAEEALRLCEEHGYVTWLGICHIFLGVAKVDPGSRTEAVALVERGLSELRSTGNLTGVGILTRHIGAMHLAHGDLPQALAAFGEAIENLSRFDEMLHIPHIHLDRARVFARMPGHEADARAEAERALVLAESIGAAGTAAEARCWLGG